jgi:hypothetical protein
MDTFRRKTVLTVLAQIPADGADRGDRDDKLSRLYLVCVLSLVQSPHADVPNYGRGTDLHHYCSPWQIPTDGHFLK